MRALLPLLACISLPAFAAGFNDTGLSFCGDNSNNTANSNTSNCSTVSADSGTYPRQDARYGRDAVAAAGKLTKVGGGEGGFDFTALNGSGQPTTPSSGTTPHPCVRDNVTSLIWEVKTADGGLRDKKWTYTWYDSVHNYGGDPGSASGSFASCKTNGRCDTEKYVADVNAAALCGFTDWRMPTVNELEGIVHFGRTYPAIDSTYFPNTPSLNFWSGSPTSYHYNYAFKVSFNNGEVVVYARWFAYPVRLVHSGQ